METEDRNSRQHSHLSPAFSQAVSSPTTSLPSLLPQEHCGFQYALLCDTGWGLIRYWKLADSTRGAWAPCFMTRHSAFLSTPMEWTSTGQLYLPHLAYFQMVMFLPAQIHSNKPCQLRKKWIFKTVCESQILFWTSPVPALRVGYFINRR